MKIYPKKIYEIKYWSFFLTVTLHVSYVCFTKQAPGSWKLMHGCLRDIEEAIY